MNKEQLLELIRNEEAELYQDFLEMRQRFGADDKGTMHTAAQWFAITTLIDKIEENEELSK